MRNKYENLYPFTKAPALLTGKVITNSCGVLLGIFSGSISRGWLLYIILPSSTTLQNIFSLQYMVDNIPHLHPKNIQLR